MPSTNMRFGASKMNLVRPRGIAQREVARAQVRFAPVLPVDALAFELHVDEEHRARASAPRASAVCSTCCASEYTSATLISPTFVRVMWPVKVRRSSGLGRIRRERVADLSFQYSICAARSSPTVENVSDEPFATPLDPREPPRLVFATLREWLTIVG